MLCIACGEKEIYIKKTSLCKQCYSRMYQQAHRDVIRARNTAAQQERRALLKQRGIVGTSDPEVTGKMRFVTNNKTKAIHNENEAYFALTFFTHTDWIHHPCSFRLDNMTYTPDFYDKKRNVFIEVSASRQAYHQNAYKYHMLKAEFPLINFEIRRLDGTEILMS